MKYIKNLKISENVITKKVVIPLSAKEVWQKWTTHDGLCSFFSEDNKIEIKPGGFYEIYFSTEVPYGSRGSEGCKILSYLPEKMLSFSWNAPPQFPQIRNSEYKTWVVILFNILDKNHTEVTLSHLGWPENKEWLPVFSYFEKAWESVLRWLLESSK